MNKNYLFPTLAIVGGLFLALLSWEVSFAYYYFLTIAALISKFALKIDFAKTCFVYTFFVFISLIIYLIQFHEIPDYKGLTGPENGIGTDDVRYFYFLNDNIHNSVYPSRLIDEKHPYVVFLDLLYPFKVNHLLEVVFANAIASLLIFGGTYILGRNIFSEKVGLLAAKLSLFCPFILNNNAVLLRDGWVAGCIVASLALFSKKRFIPAIPLVLLSLYLRTGSAAIIVMGYVFLLFSNSEIYLEKKQKPSRKLTVFLGGILVFSVIIGFIVKTKFQASFFREEFVYYYFEKKIEDTFMLYINSFPAFIRVPFSTAFFSVIPLNSFKYVLIGDTFLVRRLFVSLFALINIYFFGIWCSVTLKAFIDKNRAYICLFIFYLLSLALVAQGSMQFRHKVMIMPIYYLMVAYGIKTKRKGIDLIFIFSSLALLAANIVK